MIVVASSVLFGVCYTIVTLGWLLPTMRWWGVFDRAHPDWNRLLDLLMVLVRRVFGLAAVFATVYDAVSFGWLVGVANLVCCVWIWVGTRDDDDDERRRGRRRRVAGRVRRVGARLVVVAGDQPSRRRRVVPAPA